MSDASPSPFEGVISEIPLADAPLLKVLAQVRYPRPLDFQDELSVKPVRQALAERYPVNREAKATALLLTPDGVSQQPTAEVNWIFEDVETSWKVTLSDKSVSIETTAYKSREEFCRRLSEVVHAVSDALNPPVYDRLGVRYINYIDDEHAIAELDKLVRPVVLAGLLIPHAGVELRHSLCDTLFVDGNTQLQVRWGWLPPGTGIDPTVQPPAKPYWLFDMDSFTGKGGPFKPEALDALALDLAERAHRFFRWAITDEFIKRFGGRPQ